MKKAMGAWLLLFGFVTTLSGQRADSFSKAVKDFVVIDAPMIALTHVRVLDGTGSPALEDQSLLIADGRVQSLGAAATTSIPPGVQVKNLAGYTVIPGLVGMHDHLFYPTAAGHYNDLAFSAPRLYLAGGVTTIRTAGSVEPYTDLNLKRLIDSGKMVGPKIHVTGPYLEGPGAFTPQMHELTGPEDARKLVEYWADEGVTSFKVYMNITRAEMSATLEAAHKRGLEFGRLCMLI